MAARHVSSIAFDRLPDDEARGDLALRADDANVPAASGSLSASLAEPAGIGRPHVAGTTGECLELTELATLSTPKRGNSLS